MFGDAPLPLTIVWMLWMLQAAWCCWNQVAFHRRIRRWDRRLKSIRAFHPPAVVISPIKGVDSRLPHYTDAVLHQDYPSYRVMFVVESEDDPAFAALQRAIEAWRPDPSRGCQSAVVLVAGQSSDEGQKVHNLRHAIAQLSDADAAIAFADADAVPDNGWLIRMIRPLLHDDVGATTGYRWFVPQEDRPGLATIMASVINSSVATLLGPDRRSHAWGGSTAMLHTTLKEAKLDDHWRGALSDDYQLTRAISAIGKRVMFVPRCLVASPAKFTWASLFEFGRRQYIITRVHAPGIWLVALLATLLYTTGVVTSIVPALIRSDGWGWGQVALGGVVMLDFIRAELRFRNMREILGDETADRLQNVRAWDQAGAPLWMAVHLAIVLSSLVGRTITWGRITYQMRERQRVRILHRG